MRAINLLKNTGLTGPGIASAIGQTTHSIRLYERDQRFPSREAFSALVKLAESHDLTLLARDFVPEQQGSSTT